MESDGEDLELPMVKIGDEQYPLDQVNGNKELIKRMTAAEQEIYVRLYQEYYGDDWSLVRQMVRSARVQSLKKNSFSLSLPIFNL